jgi:hypothetical protein
MPRGLFAPAAGSGPPSVGLTRSTSAPAPIIVEILAGEQRGECDAQADCVGERRIVADTQGIPLPLEFRDTLLQRGDARCGALTSL